MPYLIDQLTRKASQLIHHLDNEASRSARAYSCLVTYALGRLISLRETSSPPSAIDSAWNARCLIECAILTQYALLGDEQLNRLIQDAAVDRIEYFELCRGHARTENDVLKAWLDQVIKETRDSLACQTAADYHHLRVDIIAKKLGRAKEFNRVVKLTHKLSHATGMSIFENGADWNNIACEMQRMACLYASETVCRISERTNFPDPHRPETLAIIESWIQESNA